MRDLLPEFAAWRRNGERFAIARVVDIEGSGPREPGAAMAVSASGQVVGSVSGGCVEGAVVSEALAILSGDAPSRVVTFGYSDDEAFAVGLTCGGTIHLFIQPADNLVDIGTGTAALDTLDARIRTHEPVAVATVIDGPHTGATMLVAPGEKPSGSLGNAELDRIVVRDALGELEAGTTGIRHYGPEGQTTPEDLVDAPTVKVFVESFAPAPQMWIFGAVDFTAALARVAKILGYRVTVCDAREIFATRRRFPMADNVVVSWPGDLFAAEGKTLGPRDAVCILTHDAKFDVPAVQGALATRVGYIGVMGSRKTHTKRLERLAEAGVTNPADLSRLMSPIGLDLGARTPEETAISICAEIIARRTGRNAPSLRDSSGPIHTN
ncbi:MAG: XdhC family protein [Acidobacteria bacterium]|nr:XdhC family protein [Acidobacteriota bacterium]